MYIPILDFIATGMLNITTTNKDFLMTFYEKEAAEEQKRQTIIDQNGLCWLCKKPLTFPAEAAHRIPKSKLYLKMYGKKIIHHRFNVPVTHKDCNSGVLLDPATHPIEAEALISSIKQDLGYTE